jgi:hypothetical protein
MVFWWDWGLNSGLRACKAGALPLEPHLISGQYFKCTFENVLVFYKMKV